MEHLLLEGDRGDKTITDCGKRYEKKKADVIEGNREGLQRKNSCRDPETGKNLTRMKRSLE